MVGERELKIDPCGLEGQGRGGVDAQSGSGVVVQREDVLRAVPSVAERIGFAGGEIAAAAVSDGSRGKAGAPKTAVARCDGQRSVGGFVLDSEDRPVNFA